MRIGRYEFGLVQPLTFRWKMWETAAENPCGCTIREWGFWYFTILRYACAGEPDTRELEQSVVEAAALEAMKTKLPVSKSEMKRLNVLKGHILIQMQKKINSHRQRQQCLIPTHSSQKKQVWQIERDFDQFMKKKNKIMSNPDADMEDILEVTG